MHDVASDASDRKRNTLRIGEGGSAVIRLSPNKSFVDSTGQSYEETNKETSRGRPKAGCWTPLAHQETTREAIQRLSPLCGLLGRGKAGAGFSDWASCSLRSSGVRRGPAFLSYPQSSLTGMPPKALQPSPDTAEGPGRGVRRILSSETAELAVSVAPILNLGDASSESRHHLWLPLSPSPGLRPTKVGTETA